MVHPTTPSRIDQIWDEQKKKLQRQFTNITEADLEFEIGRKYEMIDKLGIKLGMNAQQIKNLFQSL